MVKLFPVRTVKSTKSDVPTITGSPASKIPNRFRSKYDRSVFGGDDCVKAYQTSCFCYECSASPVIVVSAGERICDQYNITLRTVKEFLDGGLLESIHEQTFLLYAQRNEVTNEYQIGILAALDIEDCKANIVKRHERCIPELEGSVSLKQKHYQSLYVDPIMVMYRQNTIVDEIVQKIVENEDPIPLRMNDEEDSGHYIWFVKEGSDVEAIQHAFETIDALYIADGHHRTSAACKAQTSKKNRPPSSRYLSALIFPDSQLSVLSFNRCIRSLKDGMTHEQFMDKVYQRFHATEILLGEQAKSDGSNSSSSDNNNTTGCECSVLECISSEVNDIKMYLHNIWYALDLRQNSIISSTSSSSSPRDSNSSSGTTSSESESSSSSSSSSSFSSSSSSSMVKIDPLSEVDAQILLNNLIEPVLGVSYPKCEQHMVYVDGRQGWKGVQECVDSGNAFVGFTIGKMSTEAIMRVADADQLLPPKATFFDPKPLSGLLLRLQR